MWALSFVFVYHVYLYIFFFKQNTAYEMRISDWSSDVCSSDLFQRLARSPIFRTAKAPGSPPSCRKAVRHEHPPRSDRIDNRRWHRRSDRSTEIGRASCRERVCQYV